jgi:hypothetical protein
MKTKSTQKLIIRAVLFIILFLYFLTVFGQADYNFKNGTLQSGRALQTGARYKFPNVKTGYDALVTITQISGGITLSSIDDNTKGFDEAFQPIINVSSNSTGFAEFKIEFVEANTNSLAIQQNVTATLIGIDGQEFSDGNLYEQDQVEYFSGYYDFNNTGLNQQIINNTGWLDIKNTSAKNFANLDTLSKDVMVTVSNKNISGFKVRFGAQNSSSSISESRIQSIYFKKFTYPKSILLPTRTLLSFKAVAKNNGVEIQGVLAASHTFDKMIIERGNSSSQLAYIATLDINKDNSTTFPFTYFDATPSGSMNFYRIRLINSSQNIFEYSIIISVVIAGNEPVKVISFINTIVDKNNPVVRVQSENEGEMQIQMASLSGRVLMNKRIRVYKGANTIDLSNIHTENGYYVVALTNNNAVTSQKIIIK